MREHLATLLDDFHRYGGDIAVVRYQGNRRRVTTYAELARLARRFGAYLERSGIGPGDRVLLWGENCAEWIAAFHGCILRGVLAVPLDANGTAEFANRVAADVKPRLAVGDAQLLELLGSKTSTIKATKAGKNGAAGKHEPAFPRLAFEQWLTELPEEEARPTPGLTADTPLQILFTSGTTGDPKGIVLTHGNVLASVGPIEDGARPYLRWERLVRPLRILHTLPLSHVFGQTMGLWVPPIFRAELHFESRLAAPRLIEEIRRERISVLATVPRVLALLKAHLELDDAGLPARAEQSMGKLGPLKRWWRFRGVHRAFGAKFWAFVSGGGALAGPLEQFWNALGFVLVQGYGMTESTALITLNHPFHVARGTIGKPLAGREVRLGPDGEVLVRGAMISGATWQGGELKKRGEEWLATGDLAERQASGELRFLGRKSEVIVTAAGVNLHPEDMEAAVEDQPGVAACAVVRVETAAGPEPCAVVAVRGAGEQAAIAIEAANARLTESQKIRRWVLWPEPDLPRTSTGKVRRKAVSGWLATVQEATHKNGGANGNGHLAAPRDWLLALIEQITADTPAEVGDESRLTEDLHLDSLGRVQLAAEIEERLGVVSAGGLLEEVRTLGDLRRLVAGDDAGEQEAQAPVAVSANGHFVAATNGSKTGSFSPFSTISLGNGSEERGAAAKNGASIDSPEDRSIRRAKVWPSEAIAAIQNETRKAAAQAEARRNRFVYPMWPWWKPVEWVRIAFIEMTMRPLVWLLADPKVTLPATPLPPGPMLIVANHVTSYDGPLVQYALEGRVRRHLAVAMLGEMLEEYRHWRNPERKTGRNEFFLFGPAAYWLITALFNVFPLPRLRDFQASFAHAGRAMDRGYNVMVFPEGTRSAEGKLAPFRPGIGLLVKESNVPVLPVGIRGLGELKTGQRGWFRSGTIEVSVGEAISFKPEEAEAAITERLQREVGRLVEG